MIELYYWPTPNGHKVRILLEETGLPYRIVPVHIGRGEQFAPDFLRIAPNNKIPALVDTAPTPGGAPRTLFESGAILLYLAEKTGQLLPSDAQGRWAVVQWLFWQCAGLGPMAGQNHHFRAYAPEPIDYAIARYTRETARLYAVLEQQLRQQAFVAGGCYSIADIACYPWIVPHALQNQSLADYPALADWFARVAARPAVQRAYALAEALQSAAQGFSAEEKRRLIGLPAVPA